MSLAADSISERACPRRGRSAGQVRACGRLADLRVSSRRSTRGRRSSRFAATRSSPSRWSVPFAAVLPYLEIALGAAAGRRSGHPADRGPVRGGAGRVHRGGDLGCSPGAVHRLRLLRRRRRRRAPVRPPTPQEILRDLGLPGARRLPHRPAGHPAVRRSAGAAPIRTTGIVDIEHVSGPGWPGGRREHSVAQSNNGGLLREVRCQSKGCSQEPAAGAANGQPSAKPAAAKAPAKPVAGRQSVAAARNSSERHQPHPADHRRRSRSR